MTSRTFFAAVAATLALAAQTPPQTVSFQIRVQSGAAVTNLENGGTIAMTAPAPRASSRATVSVTYTGTGQVTFSSPPGILGSGAFTATPQVPLPIILQPQQSFSVDVQYTALSSALATAQLQMGYFIGATGQGANITLNLTGAAPEVVFATIQQPDGNTVTVPAGSALAFPATSTGTLSVMSVVVANRGSAPLDLSAVAVAGEAFTAGSVPLLPVAVQPGNDVRFNVRFTPPAAGPYTGELRVATSAVTTTFPLQGTGTAPQLTYQTWTETDPTPVIVRQTIAFADTAVGSAARMTVRILNGGTGEARVTAVNATGTGFSVAELAPLPIVLAPGRSSDFVLLFSPSAPGRSSGRLRIGDDVLDIIGLGLGAQFRYTHTVAEGSLPVTPGGSVIFPAVDTGRSITTRLTITNTGTASGLIPSIGLTSPTAVFTLAGLPPLPLSLDAAGEATVNLAFTPNAVGSASGTLRIGNDTFTLSGISNAAIPLPAFHIQMSDTVQAMTQPAVGITLDQPYTIPVTGTLLLGGDGDSQIADPAVQFATGGKSVSFRINPGTTQATFAGAQQVRLQTGSVAGVLTLTPSFATEGGTNLTPASVQPMRVTVPATPPKLMNVQATPGDNSLTLVISGYSTNRSVRTIEVEFLLASGVSATTTKFSLNAESSFSAWYQTSQSRAYGSQFLATVPFTLQRTGTGTGAAAQAIDSVSVRLSNELGSSEPTVVSLRTP